MVEIEQHGMETLVGGGGTDVGLTSMSSMDQVKKCWKEYLDFGEESVFRLCCDLDRASMQHLADQFQQHKQQQVNGASDKKQEELSSSSHQCAGIIPCYRPEELELDLVTFQDDGSLTLLTELMRSLFPSLKQVEVENRLLETPWNSRTVSCFLEQGYLHRLDKLVLYGVDLCGLEIGQSFQRLFMTHQTGELMLSELNICFCHLDQAMLEPFCEGLRHSTRLKKLTLFEGSINDEMLGVLVHRGLSNTWVRSSSNTPPEDSWADTAIHTPQHSTRLVRCQLHSLNLGRNQLTSQSLEDLANLLHNQSQLEFLSLSHNVELFRGELGSATQTTTRAITNGVVVVDDDDDEEVDFSPAGYDRQERENASSTGLALRQRRRRYHSSHAAFWTALYQHTRLLNFWAQSPVLGDGDTTPVTSVEQRAQSILLRNAWFKNVTLPLPHSLWPRALVACASHQNNHHLHQKSLVFAFLHFRIQDWMGLDHVRYGGQSDPPKEKPKCN